MIHLLDHGLSKPFTMAFLSLLALVSCSRDYNSTVEEWKEDGWSVVEEFGKVGDFIHQTKIKSNSAKAVEALWVIDGKRQTKLFPQNSNYYVVLRFKKTDGDVFVVVMSKRK